MLKVVESIDKHGTSSDEGMLVRVVHCLEDHEIKKEQPEEKEPMLIKQQTHAIMIHRNLTYEKLDANKFPVLASLNISNSDAFGTHHSFESLVKSKSCSFWCMYFLLTRLWWNEPNAERGELLD
jgi:hypothetical protein